MPIDKEQVNKAILFLGQCYTDPQQEDIDKAISLLRKAGVERKELKIIKATDVESVQQTFIPIGVPWFDQWLRGGIRKKELLLFGATPHGGKTHLLSWFGSQALLQGFTVANFVGEDILSDVKENYVRGVSVAPACLENLWMIDVQDSRFGVNEVESVFNKMKEEGHTPDILVIDHVDLMKSNQTRTSQSWEMVEELMSELKMLAKRTDTFIASASQAGYNREARGMERFYKSKTGKAGWSDLVIMIEDQQEDMFDLALLKARGRSKITDAERRKTVQYNWDTMIMTDLIAGGM